MPEDDTAKLYVETEHAKIEVSDRASALAALELLKPAFQDILGDVLTLKHSSSIVEGAGLNGEGAAPEGDEPDDKPDGEPTIGTGDGDVHPLSRIDWPEVPDDIGEELRWTAEVKCDNEGCGYEWETTTKNPENGTCPDCKGWVKYDPPLHKRPDVEPNFPDDFEVPMIDR